MAGEAQVQERVVLMSRVHGSHGPSGGRRNTGSPRARGTRRRGRSGSWSRHGAGPRERPLVVVHRAGVLVGDVGLDLAVMDVGVEHHVSGGEGDGPGRRRHARRREQHQSDGRNQGAAGPLEDERTVGSPSHRGPRRRGPVYKSPHPCRGVPDHVHFAVRARQRNSMARSTTSGWGHQSVAHPEPPDQQRNTHALTTRTKKVGAAVAARRRWQPRRSSSWPLPPVLPPRRTPS